MDSGRLEIKMEGRPAPSAAPSPGNLAILLGSWPSLHLQHDALLLGMLRSWRRWAKTAGLLTRSPRTV
jgi:hypothetical protein